MQTVSTKVKYKIGGYYLLHSIHLTQWILSAMVFSALLDVILFQLDHELLYAPGFPAPPNINYNGYRAYVDESLPPESPHLYGQCWDWVPDTRICSVLSSKCSLEMQQELEQLELAERRRLAVMSN